MWYDTNMITIQELHKYKKLSDSGLAPSLVCPIDYLHTDMVPWIEDDEVCSSPSDLQWAKIGAAATVTPAKPRFFKKSFLSISQVLFVYFW